MAIAIGLPNNERPQEAAMSEPASSAGRMPEYDMKFAFEPADSKSSAAPPRSVSPSMQEDPSPERASQVVGAGDPAEPRASSNQGPAQVARKTRWMPDSEWHMMAARLVGEATGLPKTLAELVAGFLMDPDQIRDQIRELARSAAGHADPRSLDGSFLNLVQSSAAPESTLASIPADIRARCEWRIPAWQQLISCAANVPPLAQPLPEMRLPTNQELRRAAISLVNALDGHTEKGRFDHRETHGIDAGRAQWLDRDIGRLRVLPDEPSAALAVARDLVSRYPFLCGRTEGSYGMRAAILRGRIWGSLTALPEHIEFLQLGVPSEHLRTDLQIIDECLDILVGWAQQPEAEAQRQPALVPGRSVELELPVLAGKSVQATLTLASVQGAEWIVDIGFPREIAHRDQVLGMHGLVPIGETRYHISADLLQEMISLWSMKQRQCR
jgi:hypothetical protein